jgi:hypothetical protein
MSDNGIDEELEETDAGMDDELYTVLDENMREEFDSMLGLKVVGLEIWEESLADEEEEAPIKAEERVFFDCDLYLEDEIALELYVAAAYPDPDKDPVKGMDDIFKIVGTLSDDDLQVLDYDQADEEGGLAIAFGKDDQVRLILVAGAWMISEWEEDETSDDEE